MRIGITNSILIIGIVVYCATVIISALDRRQWRKQLEGVDAVRFSALSCHIDNSFNQLGGYLLETNGNLNALLNELRDFRREFTLTFNVEFANKVESIIKAGETKDRMMKRQNEKGETEWVAIDHGW
jgi:hypothetical protein